MIIPDWQKDMHERFKSLYYGIKSEGIDPMSLILDKYYNHAKRSNHESTESKYDSIRQPRSDS